MNVLKTIPMLAFGSVLLAGCGAHQDESTAQTDESSHAVESPASPADDSSSQADTTDVTPSDEQENAVSDSLPKTDKPPPVEPSPPPNH
jgi:hypothetical protein